MMKYLICLFLLFIADFASGDVTLKNCGKSKVPEGRIVGGTEAAPGAYPWMIALYERVGKGFGHVCGGAILNDYWIVTAAHCFDYPDDPSSYIVFAGLHKRSEWKTSKTAQLLRVERIVRHHLYRNGSFTQDIALIKTSSRINIDSKYINGICLPPSATNPSGTGTVIGWGMTQSKGNLSDVLMQVEVPIVEWKNCKGVYGSKYSEFKYVQVVPTMLCAGAPNKDACQADSGGPFFQFNKDEAAVLIGTVANGGDCGYKNYPGMYMKVTAFKIWMETVINPKNIKNSGVSANSLKSTMLRF